MSLSAVVGSSKATDPREAGSLAASQAIEQLGRDPVVFGWVFVSGNLPINQVINGISTIAGDIPLIGMSTSGEFINFEVEECSVAIALLGGEFDKVQSAWTDGFIEDSRLATETLLNELKIDHNNGTLFVVADGFNGNAADFCEALPQGIFKLSGCLAGGDYRKTLTSQVGGRQSGEGGLAIATFGAGLACGIGFAHGWRPIGPYFKVDSASGPWVRRLNGKTTAEVYSSLFGYSIRDWTTPPLNELVRLYPLGLARNAEDNTLLVRSPLRMEGDGSLRVHAPIPEDSTVHLMAGSREACISATEYAVSMAFDDLRGARPILAIALIDISWRMLMEAQPGAEIRVLKRMLGPDVPLLGGYTYGQLARLKNGSPELLNQHIEVVLIGDQGA